MFEHLLHSSHHHAITLVTFRCPTANRRRRRAEHGIIRGLIFHPARRPLPGVQLPCSSDRGTTKDAAPANATRRQRAPPTPPASAAATWRSAPAFRGIHRVVGGGRRPRSCGSWPPARPPTMRRCDPKWRRNPTDPGAPEPARVGAIAPRVAHADRRATFPRESVPNLALRAAGGLGEGQSDRGTGRLRPRRAPAQLDRGLRTDHLHGRDELRAARGSNRAASGRVAVVDTSAMKDAAKKQRRAATRGGRFRAKIELGGRSWATSRTGTSVTRSFFGVRRSSLDRRCPRCPFESLWGGGTSTMTWVRATTRRA